MGHAYNCRRNINNINMSLKTYSRLERKSSDAVHSGGLEVIVYADQTLLLQLAFNKEGENRAEWRVAFSWRGKQEKAERRGQEDALDFEWRDQQKNPRRRFTFLVLLLEKNKTKKNKVQTGTNFHDMSLQTAPVKVLFWITNGKQKTTADEKEEAVEEIVVSGLVWILSVLQVSQRSSGGLFSQKVNFLLRRIVMHVQGLICLRRASRKDGN